MVTTTQRQFASCAKPDSPVPAPVWLTWCSQAQTVFNYLAFRYKIGTGKNFPSSCRDGSAPELQELPRNPFAVGVRKDLRLGRRHRIEGAEAKYEVAA